MLVKINIFVLLRIGFLCQERLRYNCFVLKTLNYVFCERKQSWRMRNVIQIVEFTIAQCVGVRVMGGRSAGGGGAREVTWSQPEFDTKKNTWRNILLCYKLKFLTLHTSWQKIKKNRLCVWQQPPPPSATCRNNLFRHSCCRAVFLCVYFCSLFSLLLLFLFFSCESDNKLYVLPNL